MKKKKFIFGLIIILVLIIIYDGGTNTYGWVHVTDKNKDMDTYYINGYHGNFKLMDERMKETIKQEEEELEIEVKNNYTFKLFIDENQEPEERTISEVWNYIQSGNTYFMQLKKNSFPKNLFRTYTIEDIYLY